MFSTSEILQNTNSKSYQRGLQMASKPESVVQRRFSTGRNSCEASACVRSASGIADKFETHLTLDSDCAEILDFGCDCPAARKYGVMCKHGVALALAFRKDPHSFDGYTEQFIVKSSPAILGFLDASVPSAPRSSRLHEGSFRMGFELFHNFGQWSAKFNIGDDAHRYVISDLGAFSDALARRSYLSYGKNLGFTHSLEALDAPSRDIAMVIVDAVERYKDEGAAQRSRPRGGALPKREVHLVEEDVVRLLDALSPNSSAGEKQHGRTFVFEDIGREVRITDAHVELGNPELTLRIVEREDLGFEVLRDDDFLVAMGCSHPFVIMDGTAYSCTSSFSDSARFLHDVYLSADDEVFIANEDVQRFCRGVLPMLEASMDVVSPSAFDALRPKDIALGFYFSRNGIGANEAIELTVKATYGNAEHVLLSPANGKGAPRNEPKISNSAAQAQSESPIGEYRDEIAEAEAVELAYRYFDSSMRILLDNEEKAGELLFGGLAAFQEMGEVYTTADFDRLISDKRVRVQIGLSIAGDLIDMDVHSTDVSSEELAAILTSYERKQHFHRLKDGTITSLADLDLKHLEQMLSDLGLKGSDLSSGKIEIPTYNAFLLDREYAEFERNESFDEYIYRFDNNISFDFKPPASLAETLRPYQIDGFKWMKKLSSINFGGILADEMGLGKSLQMISFLLSQQQEGATAAPKPDEFLDDGTCTEQLPALVVCPASLVYNWAEEFAKFAPGLNVTIIDGAKPERRAKRKQPSVDVFVASYDAVRMDVEDFSRMRFSTVVIDEAQFIKNHANKTTRAVKRLHAMHRFALTGTPIENRLSEIWSIFDFLMPGFLGSYAQFKTRFETDILAGDADVTRRLQSLIGPFVLRRLKSDVLDDLPEKQEIVVSVSLKDEQRKLYRAHEQNLRECLVASRHKPKRGQAARDAGLRVDVLAELMRIRQIALEPSLVYDAYKAGSSKTDALLELIGEAMDAGKKTLVFSQFTSYLEIVRNALSARGIDCFEITGATPKKQRLELVNEFNDGNVPVFLVSLKAGGTGLNLIGASVVIHADPWWNAAATNQATDRAHRIGQRNMVSVYKLIAKDTIEERILRLQQKKEDLADSVISETSLESLSSLSHAQLESLLLED